MRPAGGQIVNGTQHVTQQMEGVEEVNVNVVWTPALDTRIDD